MRAGNQPPEAIRDFLAQQRIAIAGVSRSANEAANVIYRKLRGDGYQVFPVNPNADQVEGDACYPDLSAIPGGVDAVVAATAPAATTDVVHQCIDQGVGRIWMHRSFGAGSVCDEAKTLAEKAGLRVIAGGCPMMYCEPVDLGHRCMRWLLRATGGLPKAT